CSMHVVGARFAEDCEGGATKAQLKMRRKVGPMTNPKFRVPDACEGCTHLVDVPGRRPQCSVFFEFLPKGWVNDDGSCQAYRRQRSAVNGHLETSRSS